MSSNSKAMNIEKLLDSIPDNVKDVFSSIIKGGVLENSSSHKANDDLGSLEMIMTMKKLMDKVNNNNDSRMDLIKALRPFLGSARQDKVMHCLKAFKISNFFREASTFTSSKGGIDEEGSDE